MTGRISLLFCLAVIACFVTGCVTAKSELLISPDGRGTVEYQFAIDKKLVAYAEDDSPEKGYPLTREYLEACVVALTPELEKDSDKLFYDAFERNLYLTEYSLDKENCVIKVKIYFEDVSDLAGLIGIATSPLFKHVAFFSFTSFSRTDSGSYTLMAPADNTGIAQFIDMVRTHRKIGKFMDISSVIREEVEDLPSSTQTFAVKGFSKPAAPMIIWDRTETGGKFVQDLERGYRNDEYTAEIAAKTKGKPWFIIFFKPTDAEQKNVDAFYREFDAVKAECAEKYEEIKKKLEEGKTEETAPGDEETPGASASPGMYYGEELLFNPDGKGKLTEDYIFSFEMIKDRWLEFRNIGTSKKEPETLSEAESEAYVQMIIDNPEVRKQATEAVIGILLIAHRPGDTVFKTAYECGVYFTEDLDYLADSPWKRRTTYYEKPEDLQKFMVALNDLESSAMTPDRVKTLFTSFKTRPDSSYTVLISPGEEEGESSAPYRLKDPWRVKGLLDTAEAFEQMGGMICNYTFKGATRIAEVSGLDRIDDFSAGVLNDIVKRYREAAFNIVSPPQTGTRSKVSIDFEAPKTGDDIARVEAFEKEFAAAKAAAQKKYEELKKLEEEKKADKDTPDD